MTRLLFLPDDETVIVLHSGLAASDLAERVNQGQWTPPAPYDVEKTIALHAIKQGRTVIVTPHLPLDLNKPALNEIRLLLKPRQREVMLLMARGFSNKEIAAQLNKSQRTVALHVATLKALFDASSRAESIHKAAELGFFEE